MEGELSDASVLVGLLLVVKMSVVLIFLTSLVVRVEVDTIDSVVPVGVTVVIDEDCGSVGEEIIVVDDSLLVGGS